MSRVMQAWKKKTNARFDCWTIEKIAFFYKSFKRTISNNSTGIDIEKFCDGIVECDSEVARAIFEHTEIVRNHMTPEIQLFLLTPNCNLYHAQYERISESKGIKRSVFLEPFWSIYWPGGQALARFVLDEGRTLFECSKEILDLGAGCGATAIAAKLVGADRVVANDIDRVACTAISMNAILNRVNVKVSHQNLLYELPERTIDVIFIGDMLYDAEIAATLIPWLEKARDNGTRIYLGDPGRHGLTEDLKKRLKVLRHYRLPENVQKENYGYDSCNVWEFCG
ncbi:electron transfer flavoprotein beta subunit lysine methyltransferase-like [Bombus huntii]|uniref:electron transfer flavoprotein beta subunit lysine methyltransferase-like n=1 Tax=Bombus huntii TaxID=85661 RepID=UPI0021AA00F7|nr:electron transfer flavoprotein beta subunit lysine methyltransferase-like [Bombus huntii]